MVEARTETAAPLLEARGLVKRYGHVQALRGADFSVGEAEIVGLLGDNGAGKSTLVRILSGVTGPDAGEIRVDGRPVSIPTPAAAQALGIETVHQDLALAADLDAASNVFMGRELLKPGPLGWLGVLDNRAMRAAAATGFRDLGVTAPPSGTAVADMSGGQRQGVAVGRSVHWARRLLFMDEPTAALGVVQSRKVLDLVRRVRDRGVAVVIISHNLPEVLSVADRVEVMRMGTRAAQLPADVTTDRLMAAMTGLQVKGDEQA